MLASAAALLAALPLLGPLAAVNAAPPDDTVAADDGTEVPIAPPAASGPLVVSPAACPVPIPALAVFRGRLVNLDEPPTTAHFLVASVLAGSLAGYSGGNRVVVLYGKEASFLELGEDYVVGVRVDLDTGRLFSTILQPAPLFGGDAVIGIDESGVKCPVVTDPIVTLRSDGSAIDSGVLTPLQNARSSLVAAVLQPLLIALAILIGVVMLKNVLTATGRSLGAVAGQSRKRPT